MKWRERIKGFVFLDHSWDNISNNKLKIQVDPDLETYLSDQCLRGHHVSAKAPLDTSSSGLRTATLSG